MFPNTIVAHVGLNVNSELDMDQWEGIQYQHRFDVKCLEGRIHSPIYKVLEDEYGDLPSDRTLIPVNQREKPYLVPFNDR